MVPRARRRGGFALLEVMVALALLTGALVAVAGLIGIAARANRAARVEGLAAILGLQKMEQLRGLAWGWDEAGQDRVDLESDLSVWPEASGGTGLAPSPDGTLRSNVPGFVDHLDLHGRWMGTGPLPPPGTAYIRRWSIRPLPDSPRDALVLRVVVLPRGAVGSAAGPLPPAAAQVTCIRSRRGL